MARTKKSLEPIDDRLRLALADEVAKSGYSHTAIAECVGMSQNRVSTILRGDTPPASLGEIQIIAGFLGVKISTLVGRAECEVADASAAAYTATADARLTAILQGDHVPRVRERSQGSEDSYERMS